MPIIDLQRRLREVGRIRLGDQVVASNGKKRPRKLGTFRFTSRDRVVIEAVAQLYGGEASAWEDQWQVTTEADDLRVMVPPTDMAFSQWFETWSAAGCLKRCDGRHDVVRDTACDCDPENRECRITTRLSVILPELPGLGVWRVESHGFYAATELGGAVDLVRQAMTEGMILPARLRIDRREVKRIDPAGKPTTNKFAVPVLDVDVAVAALGQAGVPVGSLPRAGTPAPAEPPEVGGWQPVPELPVGPLVSVKDQLDEVERDKVTKARKNAAEPIKPTGIEPRTHAEAHEEQGAPSCFLCGKGLDEVGPVRKVSGKWVHSACAVAQEQPASQEDEGEGGGTDAGEHAGDPAPLPPTARGLKPTATQRAKMHALAAEVLPVARDLPDDVRKELLHQSRLSLCAALGFEVTSTSDLDRADMSRLIDMLIAIGKNEYVFDGEELFLPDGRAAVSLRTGATVDVETGEIL